MAIETTDFPSGKQTTFDQTGVGPSVSGKELLGHATFGAAVGGITPEVFIGGLWTPLGSEVTADLSFTSFSGVLLRDYQFRMNCTSYTSGSIVVNYDTGR